MDRRTENRVIAALSAIVVGGLVVLVALVAIALTKSGSETPATSVGPSFEERLAAYQGILKGAEGRLPYDIDATKAPTPSPAPPAILTKFNQLPGGFFMTQNIWQGYVGGTAVSIRAGSEGSLCTANPGRGAILWDFIPSKPQPTPAAYGHYAAPLDAGWLKIVAFDGDVLTLDSKSGQSFQFDADTGGFTFTDGSPVPTDARRNAIAVQVVNRPWLLPPVPFSPCQQIARLLQLTNDNGGRQSATYAPHPSPRPLDTHLRLRSPA